MATPTYLSEIPDDTDISVAEVGARLLGYDLFDQGKNVARVLEARRTDGKPLYRTTAVLVPRRSTKTTSLWCVLIGRCATIPGYRVVTTAQDGTRAGNIMKEKMRELERMGFEDNGTGVLRWSNGSLRIEFANGSVIWTVKPDAGAFRSEAADAMLFDEAGELDPAKSADLVAGALPLMDTRPMGQVIVAGTPAKSRAGLLWDTLEKARKGTSKKPVGIVDYSILDTEDSVLFDDEGNAYLNEDVLIRVHPGIGTLTDLETIQDRFDAMQLADFEREYLCRFPKSNAAAAIDPDKWHDGETDPVDRPERVGIAYDCAYDGSTAAIAYAWRDADGNAYGEIVGCRPGTSWVAASAHKAQQTYKRVPIAYDDIGANRDPYATLQKYKPAPKMERLTMKDTLAAAQRLASQIHEGKFFHFGQSDLEAAVENTGWRIVQKSGRAFGMKDHNGASISPLVAISLALWSYDKGKDRTPQRIYAG